MDAATHSHSSETTVLKIPSGWDSIKGTDTAGEVADEEARDYLPMEYVEPFHNSASLDGKKQIEITEANLEEEILVLGEEEQELGDVRRKLERNAESVSSEMFAECQVCYNISRRILLLNLFYWAGKTSLPMPCKKVNLGVPQSAHLGGISI